MALERENIGVSGGTCEESSRDIIAIIGIQLIEKIKAYGKLRYQTQAGNITIAIGILPSKLVTTVFLGNKKTHQGTIDATAVLLHRHDQVQPARRPSLVALPISVAVAVAAVACVGILF